MVMPEPIWKSLSAVFQERFTGDALLTHQKRLKTGFSRLDRVLNGGISPGLIVLGGSPGVGKSTFAIHVAEAVSRQVPVLYFSLEMTREHIMAKIISRYLFQNKEALQLESFRTPSAIELIGGPPEEDSQWRPEVLLAIEQTRIQKEALLKNFFIMDAPLSASGIAKAVKQFIEQNGEQLSPPLVIVDYLQILPQENDKFRNERQAVEESLNHMVQLAHQGLPVILISSLSRGSYKVPMQIDSFKETGGIEYSADLLLGLQFQACHEKNMDLNAEKDKDPREVELSILKQRYGSSGNLVGLRYYPAYDCFLEETALDSENAGQPAEIDGMEIPEQTLLALEQEQAAVTELPEFSEFDGIGITDQEIQAFAQEQAELAELAEQAGTAADGRAHKDDIPRAVMCNTKVANKLRQGVCGAGNRCEVFQGVYTEYDLLPASAEAGPRPLSCFDCDVADAIYTLLSKYNRDSFSAGQVLRSLTGDTRQTLTAQKKQEITDSIEHLRHTNIAIRCEEEMRHRESKKEQPRMGVKFFQGPFLNVRQENGRYFFEKGAEPPMPLYAYGEKTGQMISFPKALLLIRANGRKLSDSIDIISVKRYLIRRLEILRNKRNKGNGGFNSISFQEDRELAALLRLNDRFSSKESRAQKQRKLRAAVLQILAYYKQIGYIKDYQVNRRYVELGKVRDPWKLPAVRPSGILPPPKKRP